MMDNYFLEHLLFKEDYELNFMMPIQKPTFVKPVKKNAREEWMSEVEEEYKFTNSIKVYKQEYFIIAQSSIVINKSWLHQKEYFNMQLSISEYNISGHLIFESAHNPMSAQYHKSNNPSNEPIIRNNIFKPFGMKSQWLAINPRLAKFLGWQPNKSKYFAWEDKNGNLMAESIYWQNGNTYVQPPTDDCCVGQGWFVIVSPKALMQIKEIIPSNFYKHIDITRSINDNDNKVKSEVFQIIKEIEF